MLLLKRLFFFKLCFSSFHFAKQKLRRHNTGSCLGKRQSRADKEESDLLKQVGNSIKRIDDYLLSSRTDELTEIFQRTADGIFNMLFLHKDIKTCHRAAQTRLHFHRNDVNATRQNIIDLRNRSASQVLPII